MLLYKSIKEEKKKHKIFQKGWLKKCVYVLLLVNVTYA